jgi:hypothetical protein
MSRVAASAGALGSALFLAGCFGAQTPAEHAADSARAIAGRQGLAAESVKCSPRGAVSWTCTGRLKSGREFTCSVGPAGRVAHKRHVHGAVAQAHDGCIEGAYERPMIAPSLECSRAMVCPHGSVRESCSSLRPFSVDRRCVVARRPRV